MKLYAVILSWYSGGYTLIGVYDTLDRAKQAIKDHFFFYWTMEDSEYFKWDEADLGNDGYGPFDNGWGDDVGYTIEPIDLNKEVTL